ncbi:MAG: PAS domain-containing sensor histidine kinase [Desulfovibrio sp.]|jgi:two-component system phosphate regulon sensor histidine kinase PhoR|nr:PAS domain-containing sensor histidine kinase [Desulfovibrio sp.]
MINSSWSLQGRLFCFFALVTIIAAALTGIFSRNTLYAERVEQAKKEALSLAVVARSLLEESPSEGQLRGLMQAARERSFRITVTDGAGFVIRDSHIAEKDLSGLDNHNDRPEVEDALAAGTGVSLRRSDSLGFDAVYAAAALSAGGVARVAVPLADVRRSLEKEFSSIMLIIVAVTAFCLLVSIFITRRIRNSMRDMAEMVEAISLGRAHTRLRDAPGREFLPLAAAVNAMADAIEEYRKITGEQQSQLETILESMHEGVLVLEPSGKIRSWNKAMLGIFPAIAGAAGKSLIEGIPVPALQLQADKLLGLGGPASNARVSGQFPAAAGSGEINEEEGVHFELPAGRFLVAHLSLPVEKSATLGAVIVVYDVTEIMRLERVRRDFVSNVSHELRTPLTAVAGYAETLAACSDLRSEYRKYAEIIHKHARRLGKIINDLLALARIENAREQISRVPLEARPILDEALALCQEQIKNKEIQVTAAVGDIRVLGNFSLLVQVFRNLLENACRYSPEKGEVAVAAERTGDKVLFIVTDNGPGIPRNELSRIFERFYQVKKERGSGTAGIGLAICKHIVERHGGNIFAQSPYKDASTAMLFTLPAAPAQ